MKKHPSAVRVTAVRAVVERADALAAGVDPARIAPLDDAISLEAVSHLAPREPLRQVAGVLHAYGLVAKADAWVETQLTPDWVAALRLTLQRGTMIVSEVRIFPNEADRRHLGRWSAEWKGNAAPVPKGGLRMRVLRRLSWGPSVDWARQLAVQFRKSVPADVFATYFGDDDVRPARQERKPGRGGRPPLPDDLVALAAKAYVEALRPGTRPNKVVADRLQLPTSQVARVIFEARRRGFLSPARAQGQPGGSLTGLGARKAAVAARRQTLKAASVPGRRRRGSK